MKDIRANAFGRPTHEAIVERLARPIDRRRIAPAALQDMDDPADEHLAAADAVDRRHQALLLHLLDDAPV